MSFCQDLILYTGLCVLSLPKVTRLSQISPQKTGESTAEEVTLE